MPERYDEGRRLGLTPEEVAARRAEFERRHREARRRRPEPEPTLGQIRKARYWAWLNCETPGCWHDVVLPLTPLIIRWGPEAPQRALRTCFRCTRCDGRETSVRYAIAGETPPGHARNSQWTGKAAWPDPLSMHYLEPRSSGHFGEIDYSPVLGSLRFDDMCNLYSNTRSRDAIRALFRVSHNRSYTFEPMPAIFPKSVAPIIRLAPDGEREMVPATWGFPLLKDGYAPKPVTNVATTQCSRARFGVRASRLAAASCLLRATASPTATSLRDGIGSR